MDATTTTDSLTIRPLSTETWPAFAELVARHNGVFGGCWCTWFHTEEKDKERTYESNRDLKCGLVESGRAHAALVFDGDEAVGWAEYGPPEELPNLHHRKEYDATQVSPPDFRITCIFVDRRYRRRGVAALALDGALDLIARAGGGVVEGYPHDMSKQPEGKKMSASFLYNGTRRMYEEAGFTFDRPKGLKNCVMTRTVSPA
ncbi:GNAT family N-acetyltransferase [Nocardioides cynanchi]|uniref:GNAT family N-acetyltransferase n=1 Tax=Nocardioides cynanchi TaxID=2558918 RepID=UPI0012452E6D|nr:GNAT family N-acetyltransferase [Nocardioides cynanchi]